LTHNNNVHGHFDEYDGSDHYNLRPTSIAVASAFFDRVTGIEVRIASIGVEIPVWFLGDPSAIETRRLWRGSMRGWSVTPGPLTGGPAFTKLWL